MLTAEDLHFFSFLGEFLPAGKSTNAFPPRREMRAIFDQLRMLGILHKVLGPRQERDIGEGQILSSDEVVLRLSEMLLENI